MLKRKLKRKFIFLKSLSAAFSSHNHLTPLRKGSQGRLKIEINKCIGCGACANVCSPRLISITDLNMRRTINFSFGKCTYTSCTQCIDACPEKAITLKEKPKLAPESKTDLSIRIDFSLVKCERCGIPFATQQVVNKLTAELSKEIEIELVASNWLKLCQSCRMIYAGQRIS